LAHAGPKSGRKTPQPRGPGRGIRRPGKLRAAASALVSDAAELVDNLRKSQVAPANIVPNQWLEPKYGRILCGSVSRLSLRERGQCRPVSLWPESTKTWQEIARLKSSDLLRKSSGARGAQCGDFCGAGCSAFCLPVAAAALNTKPSRPRSMPLKMMPSASPTVRNPVRQLTCNVGRSLMRRERKLMLLLRRR